MRKSLIHLLLMAVLLVTGTTAFAQVTVKGQLVDAETGEPLIQRDDDKPEAIRHRLEVYRKDTAPLIDFYRKRNLIADIDASVSPEEVLSAVIAALGAR